MKLFFLVIGMLALSFSYSIAQQSVIDQDKLESLIAKAKETRSEALIIYENNDLILEEYMGIGHKDTLIHPWSCTKSIVSLAIMALLDDGLLDSLDLPVHTLYPEWNQGIKKDITIEHLLTMSPGLQAEPRAHAEVIPSPDCIKLALSASVIEKPGSVWRYNNKGFNLLSDIIHKLSGKPMDVYVKDRLFKPLNITKVKWDSDQNDTPYAFLGCNLRPLDLAKIGLLVLNHGTYDGKRILSAKNISRMHQPSKAMDNYGLGWWLDSYPESHPDEFTSVKKIKSISASGSYGNYVIVIPEKNIVAVRFISYKTYGSTGDPYELTDVQRGPLAFRGFRKMIYDMVE